MTPALINLFIIIIIMGLIIGVVNRMLPMAAPFKSLLNLCGFLVCCIYILEFFSAIPNILPIPHLFG